MRKNKWTAVKLLLENGYDVNEASKMLEMTIYTVYWYIRKNKFPYNYLRKPKR